MSEITIRVDALEWRHSGPLTRAERRELDGLDRWHAATFPGPIDEWSDEKVSEYLDYSRGFDGRAQRRMELSDRDQSPERKEKSRRRLAVTLGIDPSEVEAFTKRAIEELESYRGKHDD